MSLPSTAKTGDRTMKARDAMMAAAYRGGAPLLEIGQRFGLSKQRVHQVLSERADVAMRPPYLTKKTREGRPA